LCLLLIVVKRIFGFFRYTSNIVKDLLANSNLFLSKRGKMTGELRPWGYYVILADECDHKVKRIVVYPGKRLSLQSHNRRSEHWHIVSGEAVVMLGKREISLKSGESVDIPLEAPHRIENRGSENVTFIEVQRGDYFGEDDIIRYEDDFGRV
jgi:mannose-6-phosphate isomerase